MFMTERTASVRSFPRADLGDEQCHQVDLRCLGPTLFVCERTPCLEAERVADGRTDLVAIAANEIPSVEENVSSHRRRARADASGVVSASRRMAAVMFRSRGEPVARRLANVTETTFS